MRIEILSIAKQERGGYEVIFKEFAKMIGRYAKIEERELFTKEIAKAQALSKEASQKAYAKALTPHLAKGFSIVLHPSAKELDSYEFSKLLDGKMALSFFIGGAYGFDEAFIKRCNEAVSLGRLTMSHKVAKIVLYEQIYRALSIINNHPYHK